MDPADAVRNAVHMSVDTNGIDAESKIEGEIGGFRTYAG